MKDSAESISIDEIPKIKIKTVDDLRFFFSGLLVEALNAFENTRSSLGLACSGGGPKSKNFALCARADCPLHSLCDFLYFSSSNDFWQVLKSVSEFLAKGKVMTQSTFLLEEYLSQTQKLSGRSAQPDVQKE